MHEVRRLLPTIREIFTKRSNRVTRKSCAFQEFIKTSEMHARIIKITIIIVFALTSLLVFAWEAFGSVKTTNFVSKNSARIDNFMS